MLLFITMPLMILVLLIKSWWQFSLKDSVRHMRTYDCTHDGTVADNDLYLVRFHFKNGSKL